VHLKERFVDPVIDARQAAQAVDWEGGARREGFEGRGRAVLTASNAIEYAWEGGELSDEGQQPSLFTATIVDGLRTGEADFDRDGVVSIDDLYKHVWERVRALRPGQSPQMWALGLERGLYIARSPRPDPLEADHADLPPELRQALKGLPRDTQVNLASTFTRLLSGNISGPDTATRQTLEQLGIDDQGRSTAATSATSPTPTAARRRPDRATTAPGPATGLSPEVQELQQRVRDLYRAREWKRVLNVGERLKVVAPDAADPDGLVTSAQQRLIQGNRR
jgi:hypothetical protein